MGNKIKGKKKQPLKVYAFVQEYIIDLNATQAAIRAGYSKKTAAQIGYQQIHKPSVMKLIQQAMDERAERNKITQDEVLQRYARVARFDIAKLFNEDGSLKDVREIDEDTRGAISSIEADDLYEGAGAERKKIGETKKIKTSDRLGALHDLMLHFGGFKKDNEQKAGRLDEVDISQLTPEEKLKIISRYS